MLVSFYLGLFPWPQGFGPTEAQAKVSPLHSITRQVKKGNMLVVLDTSGSMTGVPGEPFDAATELGVDCDLGDDCREVTQTGQCLLATQPLTSLPRLCSNDAQCRVGQCKYGSDPCLQDFDCPSVGSVCSKDGKPCQYNSDCSPQSSTCKVTGASCSSVQPCSPAGRCADGNAVCNNPGGSCALRYCSEKTTQTCSVDADCQTATAPPEAPADGLVAHYKMDEGTGTTVTDSAGTAENLTISGSPAPSWSTGKVNGAIQFASNGLVSKQDGGFSDLNGLHTGMTVAAWIERPTSNPNDTWVAELLNSSGGRVFTLFQGNDNGCLCSDIGTAGHCACPALGTGWLHIAMTFNGTTQQLYLNGAAVGTTKTYSAMAAYTAGKMTIGSQAGGGYKSISKIDDVRIYNRPLSAAEMQTLYDVTSGTQAAGLIGHWKFDEGTGTTAADSSGVGSNGTLGGGATWTASGKSGSAIDIGWGNYVSAPAQGALANPGQKITYAAWIYPRTCLYQQIFSSNGVVLPNFRINNNNNSTPCRPEYSLDSASNPQWFQPTGADIPLNAWSHVAATHDTATQTLKMYLNGALIGSRTDLGGTIGNPTTIFIGSGPALPQWHFDGYIDDARIYNTILPQSEIQGLVGASAPGPVAHWSFEDNVNDVSGNGFDGTREGTTAYVAGKNGKGLQFDGTTGCMSIPSSTQGSTLDFTGPYTMMAWVYRTGTGVAQDMIWRRYPTSWQPSYALGMTSADWAQYAGPGSHVETSTPPPTNQWAHYAASWDGTNMRLYIDGVKLADNPAATGAPVSSPDLTLLGCGSQGGTDRRSFFKGILDDVKFYNQTLSDADIVTAGSATSGGSDFCKPNTCVAQDNSCNVSLNTCTGGEVNQCFGVNTTDTCVINQSNTGPAKMCRFQQTFCAVDTHCGSFPGDECVPATSRSVVAKRVLRNVLLANSDIMNFGLMGFSQGSADGSTWDRNEDGVVDAADKDSWPDDYYFPYYKVQNSTGYELQDRYITLNELKTYGCYFKATGPSGSCTIGSLTYQLRSNINARYSVFKNGSFVELDQPYCGHECVITTIPQGWLLYGDKDDDDDAKKYHDATGTGTFIGGHYTFTVANGTYSTYDQPVFRKQFDGRQITINGNPYTYFKPRNDYYWNPMAGTNRPPIKGAQCGNQCSSTCGGNWDPNLIPIMDVSDNPTQAKANLEKMLPLLEKAEDGGFMHWERGPVGCALINDFLDGPTPAPNDKKKHSAWHYMQDIKAGDALVCRDNFILLITDGETNGPGDVDANGNTTCDNLDCRVQWDDPNATVGPSCQCKSVINALKLRKSVAQGGLNVKTYVIGFSPDAVIGVPATINESIARAGGTCRAPGDLSTTTDDKCMFLATNETELHESIQAVIFDTIKGSYSTTPASAMSGVQNEDKITPGGILFDARVDFPTWRGHLIAYDTQDVDAATGQPKLMWDAGGPQFFADPNDTLGYKYWTKWMKRRVYTSAGANMIAFQIDPNSGKILNRDELFALGLGNTEQEAERIAQWMLGDPKQRNKAVLGAFVNSTPIEVGPPGLTSLPGGKKFHEQHKDRVSLVYAAGDDALLHAFFTRKTKIGNVDYEGGEEAFAYIPPDMLRVVTRLYTQGGQKADPREHVYGLTSSPKVKNVCWTNCDDEEGAQWKSIMIMTDGWGGKEAFMLDVTAPFSGTSLSNPPVKVLWHTDTVTPADKSQYDAVLGSTISVPAFYYGKSASRNDHRVVFASGYRSDPPTSSEQGITLVNASALDGRVLDSDTITPSGCATTEVTTLTDVAAARNFDFREQQQMLGAFFGDTWGNLWRYVPGMQGPENNTSTTGNLSLVKTFGCQQPLHFSPAVVQPDRDDPLNHPGEAYLVQVTNSTLDPETEKFEASRMIIRKEKRTTQSGGLAADETWITGGQLELVAGTESLCGVFDPNTGSNGTCNEPLPAHARPTSTPLAILKGDGTGFVIMSLWYAPPLETCGTGRSYLTLHDININSYQAVQRAGFGLIDEPVTAAVIVDKKVVYTDSQGKVHDVTSQLNQTFVAGGAISDTTRNGGLRFQQTGWTEVP